MRLLRLLGVALLAAAAMLAAAEEDLYDGESTCRAATKHESHLFFTVLGVAQDASGNQIKRAYRKLSLKYHPG